ncbi:hypothetical protein QYE76_034479 [Lolium multiflorum]|uniref:Transposase MuDR plant domain-containing protein n=1 Tax=Lolium multiflorum TaxID=4521 RepID=A0AAD8VMK6_LOLMU|nr:hypothetical protein QYE76_034479 [Lolium multiflorum]
MRINSEQRWSIYKETVAESQDKALELFATKTVEACIELDLNRPSSPVRERTPPPMSQEEATQSPIVQSPIAQQPPLDNEYDEHDDGDDGFEMNCNNIGDLDKYWTQEEMDHSIPYSRCYASDSDDDGPEEEVDEDGFTAKEAERAEIFKKVTGRDIRVPLFRDVSLADGAVVDGGKSLLLGARPQSKRDVDGRTAMISKGLTFDTFLELKIWLKEFSIKHHRPYIVVHSDLKKRYTLKCVDKRCPWVVRARPFKKGPSWHITSCVATHMCRGPKLDGKDAQPDHRQLTSEFIAYKLSAEISSLPIMSIRSVQDTVKSTFAYDVKYGKAWKAKQAAFKMLYGDWEEAYNRIPRLLLAMAATNPGMVHVVEPSATKMTLHDANKLQINLQANRVKLLQAKLVNLLQANKLQAHKPNGNNLLQANKLQAHKPNANKLQAHKPNANKPQAHKPNGNKLQTHKPNDNKLLRNKLQGNKPQGINHNGDKLQGNKGFT